jgi:cell wall-associated NlpC family hydrolase
MARRLVALAALAALAPAAALAGGAPPGRSWAAPQIKAVTALGLMGTKDPATFRPNDALTRGALANLVAGLQAQAAARQPPPPVTTSTTTTTTGETTTGETTSTSAAPAPPPAPRPVSNPGSAATMAQLDAQLVAGLGLSPAASQFAKGFRAAGLSVPSRLGTEVVARLLGLRTDHPAAQDALELLPSDPATRAEAAFSAAQVLHFSGWETSTVESEAATFALPQLTPWQRQILNTAVHFIGYPYVWGGESETAQVNASGVRSPGGFDCSGFVWRVYKLQAYANEGGLAGTLLGRTTYVMSGEVPKAQRIAFADLQPADVVFFGERGPRSKPAQVDHMGVYLGNGWFIHSSGQGVAVAQLSGWYRSEFAWGRRPLAEAHLAG